MLKFLGALLIIFGCGGVGFYKSQKFALRPTQIRKLRSALQALETEISWVQTPLPEALSKVGEISSVPVNMLFKKAGELIKKNPYLTIGQSWEKALLEMKKNLSLGNEEIEILRSFGYSLGNSHKDEQIKNISLVREHLKSLEIEAEEEKLKFEKMYRTMGFLVGFAITLILI